MIAAQGLSIGHGKTIIGRDLSLVIEPGEIVCLLGPNGCGKTTLFRTLLALIPALAGQVTLNARPLASLGRAEIARAMAYVPQAHVPPFPYMVEEIVLMGRTAQIRPLAAPSAADRMAAKAALTRLGIGDLAMADYSRLSGGQRQMVMIARALAQDAPILVMGEPTASLDFGNQARVLGRIADLARTGGHAVILSTHDPDQAFALNARVILMHEGAILADGLPDMVLTPARLSRVYGVPVAVDQRRQFPRHAATGDRGVRERRKALARDVIDHVQHPEAPPAGELVMHEVERPARIGPRADHRRVRPADTRRVNGRAICQASAQLPYWLQCRWHGQLGSLGKAEHHVHAVRPDRRGYVDSLSLGAFFECFTLR